MLRSIGRFRRHRDLLACSVVSSSVSLSHNFFSNVVLPATASDEAVMGMIGTSVTKKLWQERLTKNKDRLKNLPLPVLTAKPPHQTTVTYPFSQDRFLQEQVQGRVCKVQ